MERKYNLAIEICDRGSKFTQEHQDKMLEFVAFKYDQNVNLTIKEIDEDDDRLKPYNWFKRVLIAGPDEFFDWLDFEPSRIMVVCKNKDKNIYFDVDQNDIMYDDKLIG